LKNINKYSSFLIHQARDLYKKISNNNSGNIVYFVSFPKSGRTWLRLMLAKIYSQITGVDFQLFLSPDKGLLKNQVKPYPFLVFGHGYQNSGIAQGKDFPEDYYKGAKIILMVRDPRDVVVSHYYHEKYYYKCYDGTVSEFIRYKYDANKPDPGKRKARFGIMPIINYMNSWQKNSHILDSSFLLTYEDMKNDTLSNLNELCAYLELPVKKELLNDVIEYCHFSNMRKLEEKNELDWKALDSSDSIKGYKTRKGKAGGYIEELSNEDILYIEDLLFSKLNSAYSRYLYRTEFNAPRLDN